MIPKIVIYGIVIYLILWYNKVKVKEENNEFINK